MHSVNRILKAYKEGGSAKLLALKWGAGAPYKAKLPQEEIEWLVHPNTLQIQAHMSLPQRAAALNVQFDREIDAQYVRSIFRGLGITKQRFRSQLGPPKPTPESLQKQQEYISLARS